MKAVGVLGGCFRDYCFDGAMEGSVTFDLKPAKGRILQQKLLAPQYITEDNHMLYRRV